MTDNIMPTYSRLPIGFVKGNGSWLTDDKGDKYLDCLSGIAVCGVGHANKKVAQAIADQANKLVHTSNLYQVPIQEQLADKLCALSGMDNVFFANSGAEANEAAIKIARKYAHDNNIDKPAIIVSENSFHGRTLATLSATGNRKIQAGFEPLVSGFIRVAYNDVEAVKKAISANKNIVAILVEPVQGEGGVNIPKPQYLNDLREICDQNRLLLMLDEIQTGMGRTGKMFAFEHNNIKPDVFTLAKSMANGVPIGACLARGEAAKVLKAGNHGSTFGGNPLACRAALATIEEIENNNLDIKAKAAGLNLLNGFKDKLAGQSKISDIRGLGLMLGIEFKEDCPNLVSKALEHKLLINVTASKVVRLLPPLTITEDEQNLMLEKLTSIILAYIGN